MGADETRIVHLPACLKVLRTLPNITDSDAVKAESLFQQVLQSSYESAEVSDADLLRLRRMLRERRQPVTILRAGMSIPKQVVFHRGPGQGDGQVFIEHAYQSKDGTSFPTQIVLSSSGTISSNLVNFHRSLSQPLAVYLIGMIFGAGELPSSEVKDIDKRIITGAEELYQCAAEAGGDFEACRDSPGARKIAEVKAKIAAEEREEAARLEAVRLAEERERARTEAEERAKERDDLLERSEELWRSAEEMRDAVGPMDILFNFGNPIKSIMGQFSDYRFYDGTADDLENARVRLQHAKWMMRAIGNDGSGWSYFEERYCSDSSGVVSQKRCDGWQRGTVTTYKKSCKFGVTHTNMVDNCEQIETLQDKRNRCDTEGWPSWCGEKPSPVVRRRETPQEARERMERQWEREERRWHSF